MLEQRSADILENVWQELVVEAHAGNIVVSWNGQTIIDAHDLTLSIAGAVGLWVPSRGAAAFDELSVEAISRMPNRS